MSWLLNQTWFLIFHCGLVTLLSNWFFMVSCTETWRHSIILDYISLVCFNQVLTAVIQRLVANIWKTCVVGFRIYLKGWTPNGDMIGVGVFELIYWKKGIPKILFFFFYKAPNLFLAGAVFPLQLTLRALNILPMTGTFLKHKARLCAQDSTDLTRTKPMIQLVQRLICKHWWMWLQKKT